MPLRLVCAMNLSENSTRQVLLADVTPHRAPTRVRKRMLEQPPPIFQRCRTVYKNKLAGALREGASLCSVQQFYDNLKLRIS